MLHVLSVPSAATASLVIGRTIVNTAKDGLELSDNSKLLFAEQQGQRQSHLAQADDANPRLALLDLALEWIVVGLAVIFPGLIGGTICGRVSRYIVAAAGLFWVECTSFRILARSCAIKMRSNSWGSQKSVFIAGGS